MTEPVAFRFCRDLDAVPGTRPPSAVVIGNFDGMHRGHQALIARARQAAAETGAVPAMVSFEPLPQAVLRPGQAPPRLLRPRDRIALARQLGIRRLWLMRFTAALAGWSPDQFARRVLNQGLNARQVIVGEDFRFGARRAGDVDRLAALGEELGYRVGVVPVVDEAGERISSSGIRRALAAADFTAAARDLGRPFTLTGRVIPGQRLGRQLGYPTANIRPGLEPCPIHGIFAVWVSLASGLHSQPAGDSAVDDVSRCTADGVASGASDVGWNPIEWPAVASIGTRPTVEGRELLLEVHLLDWQGDLYGRRLRVRPVRKLRDEARFPDLASLVRQMRADEADARRALKSSVI